MSRFVDRVETKICIFVESEVRISKKTSTAGFVQEERGMDNTDARYYTPHQ